jgi:hypothetical protein
MRRNAKIALVVVLLLGLPLLGVLLAGQPIERYLEFPPRTRSVEHEPFSWSLFIGLAVLILASVGPFVLRMFTSSCQPPAISSQPPNRRLSSPLTPYASRLTVFPFPWWGWLGLGLTAVAWGLAWTRFPWFEPLQPFTFTPLWLGYILVVNAWTTARTGRCMMLDRPRYFLSLFPLSSAFWWFFEYLNRFVQNWYYLGIQEFTPLEYFIHGTISFSTVLPAVLGTADLLASYPRLSAGLDKWRPIQIANTKLVGWSVLVLGSGGLIGIGLWPNYLFPLVWVAPLLLITALQAVSDEETIFSPLVDGDWRPLWLPALAALVCGFFYEMWNVKSLAHWEYAIPFVQRFHIFQMPILGYAGYLPFGLECVAVVQWVFPRGHAVA